MSPGTVLQPHFLAAYSTDEESPGKRKSMLTPVCSLVPASLGNALECLFAEEPDGQLVCGGGRALPSKE